MSLYNCKHVIILLKRCSSIIADVSLYNSTDMSLYNCRDFITLQQRCISITADISHYIPVQCCNLHNCRLCHYIAVCHWYNRIYVVIITMASDAEYHNTFVKKQQILIVKISVVFIVKWKGEKKCLYKMFRLIIIPNSLLRPTKLHGWEKYLWKRIRAKV